MPVFEYHAIDKRGKKVKGTIDADNLRAARQRLRAKKIFPTDLKEGQAEETKENKDILKRFRGERVSLQERAVATRQLATLLGAGLPLVSALQALTEQCDSQTFKRVLVDVREKVQEGITLSRALAGHPKTFPGLYINMVAAGEESGTLHAVLNNLADHQEASVALRNKVRSALIYPIIMLIFCSLVVVGLFIFVIPNIVDIFEQQGAELPVPTQIMIGISDFLTNFWFIIPMVALGLYSLGLWYYRQEKGREVVDRALLKAPIVGTIYLKVITARTTLTLGALLQSGVQLLAALDITRRIIGNVHIRKALEDAREGVKEGRGLAGELKRSALYPSMVCHMIAIGEKSGDLEDMLLRAGKGYEQEVNTSLDGLTSLLEPLMMIFVGGVVLAIVVSVLMPMADLIDVIQQ